MGKIVAGGKKYATQNISMYLTLWGSQLLVTHTYLMYIMVIQLKQTFLA